MCAKSDNFLLMNKKNARKSNFILRPIAMQARFQTEGLFIYKKRSSNFKSRDTDTTLSQQNLGGKLLKICKKVMLFVGLDKNLLKLAT